MGPTRRAFSFLARSVILAVLVGVATGVRPHAAHAEPPARIATTAPERAVATTALRQTAPNESGRGGVPWWMAPVLVGFALVLGATALLVDGFGFSWGSGRAETGGGPSADVDEGERGDDERSASREAGLEARRPERPRPTPVPVGLPPEVLEILAQRGAAAPAKESGDTGSGQSDDPADPTGGIDIIIPR